MPSTSMPPAQDASTEGNPHHENPSQTLELAERIAPQKLELAERMSQLSRRQQHLEKEDDLHRRWRAKINRREAEARSERALEQMRAVQALVAIQPTDP